MKAVLAVAPWAVAIWASYRWWSASRPFPTGHPGFDVPTETWQ